MFAINRGYEPEPPATRSSCNNLTSGASGAPGFSRGGGAGGNGATRGRGGNARGGASGRPSTISSVNLPGGQRVCHFWQSNTCREQGQQYCTRKKPKYAHVCNYVKAGGQVCGRNDHKKQEHDPNKH